MVNLAKSFGFQSLLDFQIMTMGVALHGLILKYFLGKLYKDILIPNIVLTVLAFSQNKGNILF